MKITDEILQSMKDEEARRPVKNTNDLVFVYRTENVNKITNYKIIYDIEEVDDLEEYLLGQPQGTVYGCGISRFRSLPYMEWTTYRCDGLPPAMKNQYGQVMLCLPELLSANLIAVVGTQDDLEQMIADDDDDDDDDDED